MGEHLGADRNLPRRAGALLAGVLWALLPPAAAADGFRVLGKHADKVTAVAFTPDGTHLVCAWGGKKLTSWEVKTGKKARDLDDPRLFICDLAVSPDGRWVASVGYLHSSGSTIPEPVRVWELATGKLRWSLDPPHKSGGRRVLFSRDGSRLITGEFSGEVAEWDLAEGKEHRRDKIVGGNCSLALSPDGKRLALGDPRRLRLWDRSAGKVVRTVCTGREVWGLAYAPDGRFLAVGEPKELSLWEAASGSEVWRSPVGKARTSKIVFSPDGRLLYTGSYDHIVRVWEAASGRLLRTWTGHRDPVYGLALSPDGATLASAGDTRVLLWGVGTPWVRSLAWGTKPEEPDLWSDLAAGEALRAYRALATAVCHPDTFVPHLEERLAAAARSLDRIPPERIAGWIRDLDSDQFAVREKASVALRRAGKRAAEPLREALEGSKSLEVRRRCRRLLERITGSGYSAEELRVLRAVQALEYADTPGARAALGRLARAGGFVGAAARRAAR